MFPALRLIRVSNVYSACCVLRSTNAVAVRNHVLWESTFKSLYSIDKIYPQSSLNIATVPEIPKSTETEFSGYIPLDQLKITYSCSSGPGGQNVNKVHTKVEVRFHLETASWIPKQARERMLEMHKNSLTKEGFLIIKSDKTRVQLLNQADCLDKLRCMIREALKPLPEVLPETREIIRRRQEKAAAERLHQKRHRSVIKADRQASQIEDF